VVGKLGRVLLKRFERMKHGFDGTKGGYIEMPEFARMKDQGSQAISLEDEEEETGDGTLQITK
jgi:hypothetical protein